MHQKMSMENYMESLANDIEQINAHPEKGCCDAVEVEVLENVLGIMNKHFSDYDMVCSENKAMAEYLAFIGFNQEHISTIANGGKPHIKWPLVQIALKESCKRSAIGFFHAQYPDHLPIDIVWEKAKNRQLQVCEAYEYFDTDSLLHEMESLESLMVSMIQHALSLISDDQ